jgi:hypothetical protein
MKKILFIYFILIFFTSYSQVTSEKLKAISIIESLSYEETMFMGAKVINTYKINYEDSTRKVEIIWKSLFPDESSTIHKHTFYIDDLDLNTIEENLTDTEKSGLFLPSIRVKAKGKLIRHDVIKEDKNKVLGNSSKTEYGEYIPIFPGMKALPRLHAERYNANVKILLFN